MKAAANSTAKGVVVVTGGGSGIGLATCLALLAVGYRVAVLDRDEAALSKAEKVLDGACSFHALDVTDEARIRTVLRAVANDFGPLTGLVNSAGIGYNTRLAETTKEVFEKTLAVNLTGTFLMIREAAVYMPRGSAVVNVSSVSGVRGSPGRAAYAASKGGVAALTRALAVELAADGIRVNAVAPGPTETPLVKIVHTPAIRRALQAVVPQQRYAAPSEIASVIAFLLDGESAAYVTGQLLPVDGGLTASAGWTDNEIHEEVMA